MEQDRRGRLAHVVVVIARTLLVGAVAGVMGGGVLFFVFGFIGFAGAPVETKISNGWRALLDPGLGKGLVVGAAIAVALLFVIGVWSAAAKRFDPVVARPWLAVLAGAMVVLFNGEALRNTAGWDVAGIATVAGISTMVAVIVWLVSPWVLREWPWTGGQDDPDQGSWWFALHEDG